MANFDDLKLAVKALGGLSNEVIFDDVGLPSIMVRFDKKQVADILEGGSAKTHSAFIVDGVEVDSFYYSKYPNVVIDTRAYSLPMCDPATGINFDKAMEYCHNKGLGWHNATLAEDAFIALQCRNGFMPRGNNSYGKDYSAPWEKGIETYNYESAGARYTGRTAGGSGPKAWAHNDDKSGVYDLNGNVYRWTTQYRTVDGEIQIIPDNNGARFITQSASSTLWKAVMPDGRLVTPGTTGTLKWDYVNPIPEGGVSSYPFQLVTTIINKQQTEAPYGGMQFQQLKAKEGTNVPEILKELGIMPNDSGDHGSDMVYMRNVGERLSFRGGYWISPSASGVFCSNANSGRAYSGNSISLRSAFVKL